MCLLESEEIDDEKIIIYTKDLYCMAKENNKVYENFLKAMSHDTEDYQNGISCGYYIHHFKSDEMYQAITEFTDVLFKK